MREEVDFGTPQVNPWLELRQLTIHKFLNPWVPRPSRWGLVYGKIPTRHGIKDGDKIGGKDVGKIGGKDVGKSGGKNGGKMPAKTRNKVHQHSSKNQ